MINILVAENAKLLSNIISTELKKNNYNCTQVFSLKEIEYEVSIQNYDYIILNLYLPVDHSYTMQVLVHIKLGWRA